MNQDERLATVARVESLHNRIRLLMDVEDLSFVEVMAALHYWEAKADFLREVKKDGRSSDSAMADLLEQDRAQDLEAAAPFIMEFYQGMVDMGEMLDPYFKRSVWEEHVEKEERAGRPRPRLPPVHRHHSKPRTQLSRHIAAGTRRRWTDGGDSGNLPAGGQAVVDDWDQSG